MLKPCKQLLTVCDGVEQHACISLLWAALVRAVSSKLLANVGWMAARLGQQCSTREAVNAYNVHHLKMSAAEQWWC